LHFAVAAAAALHGVGCGGQQFVIQERQGLLHSRKEQLPQGLPDSPETPHATPQPGQFLQCGVAAATTIEEAIDLFHDASKRSLSGCVGWWFRTSQVIRRKVQLTTIDSTQNGPS